MRTKLPNDSSKENIIELKNYPIGDTSITYHDGRKYVGKIHKKTLAPDGKGKATFTDGSYYEGDWTDGEMNGKGDFYWPDGSYYIGEYQNGRKHGVGEFKFPSGKIYKGQWADGKQNGKGKLTDKDWSILKDGEWKEGVYQHV